MKAMWPSRHPPSGTLDALRRGTTGAAGEGLAARCPTMDAVGEDIFTVAMAKGDEKS